MFKYLYLFYLIIPFLRDEFIYLLKEEPNITGFGSGRTGSRTSLAVWLVSLALRQPQYFAWKLRRARLKSSEVLNRAFKMDSYNS